MKWQNHYYLGRDKKKKEGGREKEKKGGGENCADRV